MTIILFIIILLVLVFVHELGHFLAAKSAGVKVHEFALGFPPKLWSFKYGETEYSLNLVPFGGFVRIHGENAEDEANKKDRDRSLAHKPWYVQIYVLVAGIAFNCLFAWLLISLAFMSGYPTAVEDGSSLDVSDPSIVVLSVEPASPAAMSGIAVGDKIRSIGLGAQAVAPTSTTEVQELVGESRGTKPLSLTVSRGAQTLEKQVTATSGLVAGKYAIGITMGYIGTVHYGFAQAFSHGATTAWGEAKAIALGFVQLLSQVFHGKASLGAVTGPVGIAKLVGDASQFGIAYLLGFTAFISLNLAVINLVPFPALDGGRIAVIAIETISRRKIPGKVQLWINGVGFALLLLLMLVVTVGDVIKLFK